MGVNAGRTSVFDLKWTLVRRITLIASICILVGVSIVLYKCEQEIEQAQDNVAESVAKHLELPLQFHHGDVTGRFRESYSLLTQVMSPGQCVRFFNENDVSQISNCKAFGIQESAPFWFTSLYKSLFSGYLTHIRPIAKRNGINGNVVVTTDIRAAATLAWSVIARMLSLSIALVLSLCLMVYVVVLKSLMPAEDIIIGINKLAEGNLKFRLPKFQLTELQRIASVFNNLAENLDSAVSERAKLARRLLEAREQERTHLARILHDELAQNISAIYAIASSIKISAATDCPQLTPEADNLSNTVDQIMKGLRQTVLDLRLQEINGIGLKCSLHGLITSYKTNCIVDSDIELKADEDADSLPPELSVTIFHIIQEGLTNAIKHARADHIVVKVTTTIGATKSVSVEVRDDGVGMQDAPINVSGFGLGLIGIHERTLAFGGKMNAMNGHDEGFILSVTFPLNESMELEV